MPKNEAKDIKSLGFTFEMFSLADDTAFDIFIGEVLDEQAKILEGRLGAETYNAVVSPWQENVKRAEKAMVAAELIGRRINIILSNVSGAGQEIDTKNEEKQRLKYEREAEDLIGKLISGISLEQQGFSSGVLVTSHFS
tara:strand:+ start:444 stop:860 length:417 start_codon:yes stop_codon:yes gene_type:complete